MGHHVSWWIVVPLVAVAVLGLGCLAYTATRRVAVRVSPTIELRDDDEDVETKRDQEAKRRIGEVQRRVMRLTAEVEVETRRRRRGGGES